MKSTNRRSKYYVAGSTAVLFALTANVRAYDFPEISPRIVGGRDATKGDYPFFARWSKSCGATVIHDDILLTAAHCSPVVDDQVIIGAYTLGESHEPEPVSSVSRKIESRIPHPDFDSVSWQNDVMLLKLYGPVPDGTPRITLNTNSAVPMDGSQVRVIGMGRLDEDGELGNPAVLQEVDVSVISYEQCNSDEMYNSFIDDATMICAGKENGGQDACFGDSGGPLLQTSSSGSWIQIGIVSFGVGCARADKPGVYTRLSVLNEWIQEGICEYSSTPPSSCSNARQTILDPTESPTPPPTPAPTPSPTRGLRTRERTKTRERSLPMPDSIP